MSNLSLLGKNVQIASDPSLAIIESVPNNNKDVDYIARFTCPEFTSICPVTGQPDFAIIIIDYIPDKLLVESKALKLFLQSFRNHGAFHEDCTITIAKRIISAISPKWLRIAGYWNPRGGIPIDVFFQTDETPSHVWIHPIDIQIFRGR